jgi:hypothetical protein
MRKQLPLKYVKLKFNWSVVAPKSIRKVREFRTGGTSGGGTRVFN